MSHSALHLTGNCSVACVLTGGAICRRTDEAGTQNAHIAGFTGEGLNCGRGDNKQLRNCKVERFWISENFSFFIYTKIKKKS